jgi:hypothetical protein
VAAHWLTSNVNGDANDDGVVEIADVQFMAANWLQGGGSQLAAANFEFRGFC